MINLTATRIEGTDNGWLVCEVQEVNGDVRTLSSMKVFCAADKNTAKAACALFPVERRNVERAHIAELPKTRTVTVSETEPTVEIIKGRAVRRTITKKIKKQVTVCDEFPVFDEKTGERLYERSKDGQVSECVHYVPRLKKQLVYSADPVKCATLDEFKAEKKAAAEEIARLKEQLRMPA